MSTDLKESVIYITGATAGIGYATAQLCLEKGAQVIITGRNKERLAQAQIRSFEGFIFSHCSQC